MKHLRKHIKRSHYYVYMVLAAIGLGTIGVFIKQIDSSIPFMTINFLRVFIAFLLLLPIVYFIDRPALSPSKTDLKKFLYIGIVFAISTSLFNVANVFAPVQNATIIGATFPFFVMLFAYFILKEKITKPEIISGIIVIIGLAIVSPFQNGSYILGNMLALLSAITYGLLLVLMRQIELHHGIGTILRYLGFASLVLSPAVFIFGLGDITKVRLPTLGLGVVGTGLAYLLFNFAIKKIKAEVGSLIIIIISSIVSIALAILFIGETISVRTLIGGVVLLAGGIYLEFYPKKL